MSMKFKHEEIFKMEGAKILEAEHQLVVSSQPQEGVVAAHL